MRPKYKTTGCARFFVFLLIFVPVVFFGAAYIRGENGIEIIREFFQKIAGKESADDADDTYSVGELERKLKEAREEIEELRKELLKKEEEIRRLKNNE